MTYQQIKKYPEGCALLEKDNRKPIRLFRQMVNGSKVL
jgi:hypothetical protein